MNEKLNEIFNIEEQKQPESIGELINIPKQEIQISSNKQEDLNVDYTTVRQNLKELISKGNTAIEGILHVASEGDSPRAYEVVGQLIKTLADANKDLLELHNKVKQIKSENTVTNNNQTQTKIDNAIFVGSTADLQKMLKGQIEQIKKSEDGI
jgi:hypothetical protein